MNSRTSSAGNKSRPRLYYGYIILLASFLIMVLTYGAQSSFGVFFKPMLREFGWTRAETAGPVALYMVVSGVLSVVSGRMSDRFGARWVVSVGAVVLGSGYILTSRINSLWQLYLCYGGLAAAGAGAMYIPPVTMIARWFTRRRGLMSGVGIAGIGFGIGIIPAFASQLIVSFDWRLAFTVVGAICLLGILLLAQLLRGEPVPAISNVSSKPAPTTTGYSFREAVRTSNFWLIFAAWVFYGFFFQIGIVHIVPYATDLGLTAVAAASVLSVIGIVGTFGRVGLGLIGDRLGNSRTVLAAFAVMGVGYGGLVVSGTVGMVYTFAVIFGALSGVGVLIVPLLAEHYGFRELGYISGTVVFANCLGGAISPPLAGAIFDATQSYRWAFAACGALGLTAGFLILRLKRPAIRVT